METDYAAWAKKTLKKDEQYSYKDLIAPLEVLSVIIVFIKQPLKNYNTVNNNSWTIPELQTIVTLQ